jgi:BlaR1 peptidase M56/Gram-negative bacterial TonB protein C-terminal
MLTYFVQVNVCWLLFYGAYFALLSRETFFRLNRIWLIISLLAGLILPLVAPTLEVVEPTNVAAIMLEPIVISASDLGQNLQNTEGVAFKILAAIYGLGVAVSLGKLLMGFWTIKRLLNRAEKLPMDDFTLMQVREAIAPFSFFQWVFINLNLVQPTDLQQIILHERAHVRERHSFDVVFAEVLGVIFWWSPLVYFYTKSLKNVHEYAADAVVLRTSSPPQYGRLLLRQQQSGMSLSLANPFFSQLKKRILMMTRNPSKRRALAKYALALPIFLVLMLLLASPKTRVMASTEAATDKVVSSIETFEKNLTTPQLVGNEVITPNNSSSPLSDTIINDKYEPVFTLDNKTPSSYFTESVEEIRKMKNFTVGDLIRMPDGKIKHIDDGAFTVTRMTPKNGTTQLTNVGSMFSKEVLQLVQMAENGDTYQFTEHERTDYEGIKQKAQNFTIFVGERPEKPSLDALDTQQKAELAKIAEMPVILLAGKRGGIIDANTLSNQDHLDAYQVVDGKTIPVEIVSFILFRAPRHGDPMQVNNTGGQFSQEAKRVVQMAAVDDQYQFMEIKCRIKGENTPVNAGSLGVVVKGKTPQYEAPKDSSDPVFTVVEENPSYVGGNDSLFRFLGRNIIYPAEARQLKVEGTVYVGFIVEKDGSITNIKVKRNVPQTVVNEVKIISVDGAVNGSKAVKRQDQSCAKEAIRVISMMPKWNPGKQKGVPIRVAFTLPIKFKLE